MAGGNFEGFPPDFVAALQLLAGAMEDVAGQGLPVPVLVGGAAVELWTAGRYVSGDFDLVVADPGPIEAALVVRGFRREDREGHLLRGLYHPDFGIGVEVVSGALFDGLADRGRIRLVETAGGRIRVIPPEDVIADRLGQYEADRLNGRGQLALARMVFHLAARCDVAYLLGRTRQEMSAPGMTEVQLLELLSDGDD